MNILEVKNDHLLNEKIKFSNFRIVIANRFENAVTLFLNKLSEKLEIDEQKMQYTFEFEINKELKKDSYNININKQITYIEGGSESAFYYASLTLIQLLSLNENKKVSKIEFYKGNIVDKPYNAIRSFYLDESLNFLGYENLIKIIKLLSSLKINQLIWNIGNHINFKVFPPLNNNYYAYHEIKQIIRFAKENYLEIIPILNFNLFNNFDRQLLLNEYKNLFKTEVLTNFNDNFIHFELPYFEFPLYKLLKETDYQAGIINKWDNPSIFEFYLNPRLLIYANYLWTNSNKFDKNMIDKGNSLLNELEIYYANDNIYNGTNNLNLKKSFKENEKNEYLYSLYGKNDIT